jgi:hypothetical protein
MKEGVAEKEHLDTGADQTDPDPADGLDAVQPSRIMGTVTTVIMGIQKESGSGSKCRVHQAGSPNTHSSTKCASH